jgi:hypothetical protein
MKTNSIIVILSTSLLLVLTLPRASQAYIDPGSGYIFLQVVFAVLLGGFFAFKRFWLNILEKLHLYKPQKAEEEPEQK